MDYNLLIKQIDWKTLLIANYKTLNISEEEVMVILASQYCLEQGEKTITPEILSLKMTYSQSKISEILTSLTNKSLILFEKDNQGNFSTSLKGIQKILLDSFLDNQESDDTNNSLFNEFEKEFGRPLSFSEIEMLKNWITEGEKPEHIRLALQEAIKNNVRNMRYIDKILLNWKQQSERKNESYTTISDEWRKDMKETLEIANIKWVDKK